MGRFILLFVSIYMLYYFVYYILYRNGIIDWERFTSLVFELMPYTIIIFIGVILFSKVIEHRFSKLTNAIEEVAQGNFQQKLDIKPNDPFHRIYQDFNLMSSELDKIESLRDDFVNQFSHEFKTPITSIQGFTQLLRRPQLDEEERLLYLETIDKEAKRLEHLATNVMILTALEGQEIVTDKQWFNLTEQLKQLTIAIYPQLESKEISLELDLDNIDYYGNPHLLAHIWNNLLSNALKFTNHHGRLSIKVWKANQSINVSFTNNGPLIPKEKISYLFDKFYQEDKTGKKEGLGLGLSIVKRALYLTGGTISVDSNTVIQTRFTVTLPINVET